MFSSGTFVDITTFTVILNGITGVTCAHETTDAIFAMSIDTTITVMCQSLALIDIFAVCVCDIITTVHVTIFALTCETTIIISALRIDSAYIGITFINISTRDSFFRILLVNEVTLNAFTVITAFFAYAIFGVTDVVNTNLEFTRTWRSVTLVNIFAFIDIVSGKTGSTLFTVIITNGIGALFISFTLEVTFIAFVNVNTWCSITITKMTSRAFTREITSGIGADATFHTWVGRVTLIDVFA